MGKLTIWLIFILIASAITWACLSPVDEVAVARGKVVPDGNIKVIQSLEGGVIKNIYVREGETVKKGQLLVELDMDISLKELEKKKSTLETIKLEREFLKALLNNNDTKIEMLLNTRDNILSTEILSHHKRFKELKQKDFQEKNQLHDLNYNKTLSELEMAEKSLDQIETELKILEEDLADKKTLYEKGAISEKVYKEIHNKVELAKQNKQ